MSRAQWKEALEKAVQAKRCGAKTREGQACQSPAMVNGRCRMHGGKSSGAPCGESHGRYINGNYTKIAKSERAYIAQLLKQTSELIELVG
jgi:hypothetical protein